MGGLYFIFQTKRSQETADAGLPESHRPSVAISKDFGSWQFFQNYSTFVMALTTGGLCCSCSFNWQINLGQKVCKAFSFSHWERTQVADNHSNKSFCSVFLWNRPSSSKKCFLLIAWEATGWNWGTLFIWSKRFLKFRPLQALPVTTGSFPSFGSFLLLFLSLWRYVTVS